MSAAGVMAIVLFLFFLVGVAVGVLLVVAVSARRAHKAVRPVAPPTTWPHLPGPGPDDSAPDEPAWWHARER
jgi:hypothetical protein